MSDHNSIEMQFSVKTTETINKELAKINKRIGELKGDISGQAQKELENLLKKQGGLLGQLHININDIKGMKKQVSAMLQQQLTMEINDLSKKLLSKRLEEDMLKELDKIKQKGLLLEEQWQEMRNIIRGHKTIDLTQAPLITDAVAKISKSLTEFIEKQSQDISKKLEDVSNKAVDKINSAAENLSSKVNDAAEKATKKLDDLIEKGDAFKNNVEDFQKKIDELAKLDDKNIALELTKTINSTLDDYVSLDKFYEKIDSTLSSKFQGITGQLDDNAIFKQLGGSAMLKQFGIEKLFDSKKILGPFMNKINTNIASNLSKKLAPLIKKHVEFIRKITTKIGNLMDKIKKAEEHFKKMIQEYQEKINQVIKDMSAKLGAKISSELGVKLGGAIGDLTGGIKLGI
jgi:methyl-accepting chemotaxis protein